MALLRRLYGRLRLKINEDKSAAASVFGRKFLGYSFWVAPGGVIKRKVADKPLEAFKRRIRQLTRRLGGRSMQEVAERLRVYVLGGKLTSGWRKPLGSSRTWGHAAPGAATRTSDVAGKLVADRLCEACRSSRDLPPVRPYPQEEMLARLRPAIEAAAIAQRATSPAFAGLLQIDGYGAYKRLAEPSRAGGPVTLAACWARLRRRSYELHVANAASRTVERMASSCSLAFGSSHFLWMGLDFLREGSVDGFVAREGDRGGEAARLRSGLGVVAAPAWGWCSYQGEPRCLQRMPKPLFN